MDFFAAIATRLQNQKKTLVSKTLSETASGVNSNFWGKLIMDLRNRITWEVLMEYG